jgi:hypothetical protein
MTRAVASKKKKSLYSVHPGVAMVQDWIAKQRGRALVKNRVRSSCLIGSDSIDGFLRIRCREAMRLSRNDGRR